MSRIIPWIVYAVSVYLSRQYAEGYWVVGPVFAVAYFGFHLDQLKKGVSFKHAFFLGASTLTYALVYWISSHGWKFKEDAQDMFFGPLTVGVVLGSLLLPFLHGIIFSADTKTLRKVSLWLILSWYATCLVSMMDDVSNVPWDIDYLLVAIALWQGIYFRSLKIS